MDAKDMKDVVTVTGEQVQQVAKVVEPVVKEWAKELLEWARAGKDFVAEQAPLICQEIITWGIMERVIFLLIGLTILGVTIAFHKKAIKYLKEDREKKKTEKWHSISESTVFLSFATVVGYGLGAIIFFVNLHAAAKVFFAPRVYLIEYLSALVK